MPSKNTFSIKPIKELLGREVGEGVWIDPFVRDSCFKHLMTHTNDLNPEFEADYHCDAIDFLQMFEDESIDGVLFDPPYSPRQVQECYNQIGKKVTMQDTQSSFWTKAKAEIARVTKPKSKVIRFGWNSGGIGKVLGFEMTELLLVYHGGNHNDTIVTVERKL